MKNLIILNFLLFALTSCTVNNVSDPIIDSELNIESNDIKNSDDIVGNFTITNDTDEVIGFGFSSGCQATFNIYKEGVLVFNGVRNTFCTQALTSFELEPNESKSFGLKNGYDVNFTSGEYIIKSYLIGYEKEVFATGNFIVD